MLYDLKNMKNTMLDQNSLSLKKLVIDFEHQFYKNQEFRNQTFGLSN